MCVTGYYYCHFVWLCGWIALIALFDSVTALCDVPGSVM